MSQPCPHVDQIQPVGPGAAVCEECVAIGGRWKNLRQCMTCGLTLCCSESPNTHSLRHFEAMGHPIMRSLTPGQSWLWCYVCRLTLREIDGEIRPDEG
jgi:uncharacterized UBP type Zn finger protein